MSQCRTGRAITLIICMIISATAAFSAASEPLSPGAKEIPSLTANVESVIPLDIPSIARVQSARKANGEVHIYIFNNRRTAQNITLKINNLQAGNYDFYQDGSFKGLHSSEDLQAGVKLALPEMRVPEWQISYIRMVNGRAKSTKLLFENRMSNDMAVAFDALADAQKYASAMLGSVQSWRTVQLILTPKDAPGTDSAVMECPTPQMQQVYIDANMNYYNRIRQTICNGTNPGEVRNLAMSAVTPIKVDYQLPKNIIPGLKFTTRVVIKNETDVPVDASSFFAGAPGWVFKPKKATSVKRLGSQQTATIEYWSAAPSDPAKAAVRPNPGLDVRVSGTGFKFYLVPVPEPAKKTPKTPFDK